jgi:hypothetical protein
LKTTRTKSQEEPNRASSAAATEANAAEPKLPHDRDESSAPVEEDGQHDHNRKPIAQAHHDVESGVKDTERIGTPNDVPSSGDNRG